MTVYPKKRAKYTYRKEILYFPKKCCDSLSQYLSNIYPISYILYFLTISLYNITDFLLTHTTEIYLGYIFPVFIKNVPVNASSDKWVVGADYTLNGIAARHSFYLEGVLYGTNDQHVMHGN